MQSFIPNKNKPMNYLLQTQNKNHIDNLVVFVQQGHDIEPSTKSKKQR